MNIVKPYARILAFGETSGNPHGVILRGQEGYGIPLLRKIEFCGRISHRSEDAQTSDSWQRFIKAVVLDHGDWSITEHASVTCDFLVDRGITHELVRHRLMSFTQESTRFVNYEKKIPPSIIWPFPLPIEETHEAIRDHWVKAMAECEKAYKALLAYGVTPQIARSVFPNALASRIIITANLRSWRHVLIMRTTKESHPQMREVMIPLLQEFKDTIPLLYDDIEPNMKQSEAMKKAR